MIKFLIIPSLFLCYHGCLFIQYNHDKNRDNKNYPSLSITCLKLSRFNIIKFLPECAEGKNAQRRGELLAAANHRSSFN